MPFNKVLCQYTVHILNRDDDTAQLVWINDVTVHQVLYNAN